MKLQSPVKLRARKETASYQQYCQKKVTFFGEIYTVDGHQPMPDKVQAVTEMTTPTSVTELQCFLGMCNFLSKFSPRMAEISEPLRQLTCKGIPFMWGPEHTEAFQLLKREISTAPILQYYDPKKPVVLQTDACTKGLGAVLLQDGHPVYFASKSLTAAQQNYVAIELEALAVSWAVQKLHHYLYGTSFTLQTDQKPLQAILSKSLVEATPRMQRLLLPTIPYDMAVEYIKGETNFIADCLSRAPVAKDTIKLPIFNQITAHARCTQVGLIDFDSPLPKMILWHSSNIPYSTVGHKPSQNCHQSCIPTGL